MSMLFKLTLALPAMWLFMLITCPTAPALASEVGIETWLGPRFGAAISISHRLETIWEGSRLPVAKLLTQQDLSPLTLPQGPPADSHPFHIPPFLGRCFSRLRLLPIRRAIILVIIRPRPEGGDTFSHPSESILDALLPLLSGDQYPVLLLYCFRVCQGRESHLHVLFVNFVPSRQAGPLYSGSNKPLVVLILPLIRPCALPFLFRDLSGTYSESCIAGQ